jgi:hypothetical protein
MILAKICLKIVLRGYIMLVQKGVWPPIVGGYGEKEV